MLIQNGSTRRGNIAIETGISIIMITEPQRKHKLVTLVLGIR
jgi:hypothetical protein